MGIQTGYLTFTIRRSMVNALTQVNPPSLKPFDRPGWPRNNPILIPAQTPMHKLQQSIRLWQQGQHELALVQIGELPESGERNQAWIHMLIQRRQPPDLEIAEVGFFAPDDLPEGTTEPTQARLAELQHGQPAREIW